MSDTTEALDLGGLETNTPPEVYEERPETEPEAAPEAAPEQEAPQVGRVDSSGVVLVATDDDPTDWSRTCRYCGHRSAASQSRAAHERGCHKRPAAPPCGPGPFDVRITTVARSRYTWSAFKDGELVANALGRTWTVNRDCEDNAAGFLAGPWQGPNRDSERKRKRLVDKKKGKHKGRGSGALRDSAGRPGPSRRVPDEWYAKTDEAVPAVPPRPLVGQADLLDVLDKLAAGGTWPTSALPDIGRWMLATNELLRQAVPKA